MCKDLKAAQLLEKTSHSSAAPQKHVIRKYIEYGIYHLFTILDHEYSKPNIGTQVPS